MEIFPLVIDRVRSTQLQSSLSLDKPVYLALSLDSEEDSVDPSLPYQKYW